MAKTKEELLTIIGELSGEVLTAERELDMYSHYLQVAEKDAESARQCIDKYSEQIKRAKALIEITAAELVELNNTK